MSETLIDERVARELLSRARAARRHAYAPYSSFPVGAALLTSDGRVFIGVNVENTSFGLTTCAERSAVACAISAGAREYVAIAVAGPQDELACPPCGSCRQILHEFAPDLVVVTAREHGEAEITPLASLLPSAFGPRAFGQKHPHE